MQAPRKRGKAVEMSANVAAHVVRIHIDREAYGSPIRPRAKHSTPWATSPSTRNSTAKSRAMRKTSGFRVTRPPIHLKEDEHFYSQKVFDILVNGDEHEIDTKRSLTPRSSISTSAAAASRRTNTSSNISHGPVENPSGTLAPGQKVKVKDGMRFRVAGTGKS